MTRVEVVLATRAKPIPQSMFECPHCSSQAKKLVGTKQGIFCSNCYQIDVPRNTNLHMKNGSWGEMTWAKSQVIDNRVMSRDDSKTIIDRRTGRKTEY